MLIVGILAVVVLVLAGLTGAFAARQRASALEDARDQTTQLVRLQTIRTSAVAADANATNAFLVGGLEPPAQREAYEEGIATATATLAEASADASASDAARLGEANQALASYTGLVESARANNRQGFPVGVAYLRQASTLLRDEVLPTLSDLSNDTQRRVDDAYDDSDIAMTILVVAIVIGLAAVIGAQLYLTTRTRRVFSIPIVIGGAIVLGASIVAVLAMIWAQSMADDVHDNGYRTTVALAQARIDAFDAKSAESLTLINRGSGAAYEERFQELARSAQDALRIDGVPEAAPPAFASYLAVHDEIRRLDDEEGNWEGAVALATGDAPDGSNAAFQDFDDITAAGLDESAASIADDLDDARLPLTPVAVLLVLAGAAAAIAVWQGISVRLREYR